MEPNWLQSRVRLLESNGPRSVRRACVESSSTVSLAGLCSTAIIQMPRTSMTTSQPPTVITVGLNMKAMSATKLLGTGRASLTVLRLTKPSSLTQTTGTAPTTTTPSSLKELKVLLGSL